MKKFFFLLVISIFVFCPTLYSQIVVPNYFQIFRNTDKPVRNMIVKNQGEFPLIVNTFIKESIIDNQGKENEISTKNLIVAPKNFALGPHEQKTIRLLVRKSENDIEKFYKITFFPKPLTSEKDFKDFGTDEKSIGIRIVTGIVATAYVEPIKREINVTHNRDNTSIKFSNNGNYHTRIFEVNICNKDILDKSCKEVEKFFTLRPKQTKTIKIPKEKFLLYKEKQTVRGKILEKIISE